MSHSFPAKLAAMAFAACLPATVPADTRGGEPSPPQSALLARESPPGFLDLRTGEIVWPEPDQGIDEKFYDQNAFLRVPQEREGEIDYADMESFIATLENSQPRRQLIEAIQSRGAFHRFKNIVLGGGDIELRHAWHWFETRRRRERIVAWLEQNGIEPQWDRDMFQPPTLPNRRPDLLRLVLEFVRAARQLAGVRRIALLGSLATSERQPKEVDLLVVVDEVSLGPLAKLKRRLQAQTSFFTTTCRIFALMWKPSPTCPSNYGLAQAQGILMSPFPTTSLKSYWPHCKLMPPVRNGVPEKKPSRIWVPGRTVTTRSEFRT